MDVVRIGEAYLFAMGIPVTDAVRPSGVLVGMGLNQGRVHKDEYRKSGA